jgi:hypothetical protein
MPLRFLLILRAGFMVAALTTSAAAAAQVTPTDREDAALAYAQCVRDNGYSEFPDPTPDGLRFLIDPQNVARFKKAADACRALAPEGMRDEAITPERLDALLRLSQCVRENGVPDFPDPDPKGRYDFGSIGIKPGDARFESAMTACRDRANQAGRIAIGG